MPKSPERCREIREEMRNKILRDSLPYFARNGFSGTKMSDLAKYLGVGQGTIYVYFQSKEELFQELFKRADNGEDVKELKALFSLPLPAKQKLHMLSKTVLARLETDESYAGKVALNTQMMFEKADYSSGDTTYESEIYQYTAKIIEQGQREGSVAKGSPVKLADYYWGVVYLYALKKLFTTKYEMITAEDLERVLLK